MNTIVQAVNSAGQAFVDLAVPMLVQSSVLILVLLLINLILRRRVRATFRYWIWMVVLVKLVLPPSLWSPVSIGTWFGEEIETPTIAMYEAVEPQSVESDATPVRYSRTTPSTQTDAWVDDLLSNRIERPMPIAGNEGVEPQPPQQDRETQTKAEAAAPPIKTTDAQPAIVASPPSIHWQGFVLLGWTGAAIALLLLLGQRALFVKDLIAQAHNAPTTLQRALDDACTAMGVKRKVRLKVSPNALSPAVCGLFTPTILIPQNIPAKLSPKDLQAVLLHELAHVKRGDLWVNLLQTLLQIIYFYNPLLWLANAMIRRVREKAVDEAVLVAMGKTARHYPQTLLTVAKLAFRKRPALSLRLIGVVESKSTLRSRIKHILGRPLPKSAKLSVPGLAVILLVAAVFLPMANARPLTDRAANIMPLARQEARRLNHTYVGTEHILLALARQDQAVSTKVFKKLGVNLDTLRTEVGKFVQPGPEPVTKRRLSRTPRVKRVMKYAREEARTLAHDYIGTEHILLGLIREKEGIAAQALANLDLTGQQIISEVLASVRAADHPVEEDSRPSETRNPSAYVFPDLVPRVSSRSISPTILKEYDRARRPIDDLEGNLDERQYAESRRRFERLSQDADVFPINVYAQRWLILLDWLSGDADALQTADRLNTLAGAQSDPAQSNFTRAYAALVLAREGYLNRAHDLFVDCSPSHTPQWGWFAFALNRRLSNYVESCQAQGTDGPVQRARTRDQWQTAERDLRAARTAYADYLEYELLPLAVEAITSNNGDERAQIEPLQITDFLRYLIVRHTLCFPPGLTTDAISSRFHKRIEPKIVAAWRQSLDRRDKKWEAREIQANIEEIKSRCARMNLSYDSLPSWWRRIQTDANNASQDAMAAWVESGKLPGIEDPPEADLPQTDPPKSPKRVYLPDLETPDTAVVLDLASGQMLSAEPSRQDEGYFTRLGKGDIVYEHAQNKHGLLCLRGARLHRRTETGVKPLTPDVTREAFVVYFLEGPGQRYQVCTAEGKLFSLEIVSIDQGDGGGALVEFEEIRTLPEVHPKESVEIVLPDADRKSVMLDLDSGQLVAVPMDQLPEDIGKAILDMGRGDIVHDSRSLILVRNATSPQVQKSADVPFPVHRIGQHLPETITVTTAEGRAYKVTITAVKEQRNCTLRCRLQSLAESTEEKTLGESHDGSQTVKPDGVSGKVVDPDGNPVAGAHVALCSETIGVTIMGGRLVQPRTSDMKKGPIVETDAQGSFRFEDEMPGDCSLVAAHDSGFAQIESNDFKESGEIRLARWGRIEGQLASGRTVLEDKVWMSGLPNTTWLKHRRQFRYETLCDNEGRFVFTRVPAGRFEVGYLASMGQGASLTSRTPVEVEPGQTTTMKLGGEGRPVIGKFVPPEGYRGSIYFGQGLRSLSTTRPQEPRPDNYDQMTRREQQEWYKQWSETPAAKAFYEAIWSNPNWRQYCFEIQDDGSFRIEDVIPGSYTLTVWLEEQYGGQSPPEEIGGYNGTIEVPEMNEAYSAEPLDVGELTLYMTNSLHVGDVAPLFEAKTIEGQDIRLVDYRGQHVLLSFWQPVYHPELEGLKTLYADYRDTRQLQIIGLGGSDTLNEINKYVDECKIEWPQIYVGPEATNGITKQYSLPGLPYILLIDPEGKILATWLRGQKLTDTVRQNVGAPKHNLSGHVIDPDGNPVAGAQVALGMENAGAIIRTPKILPNIRSGKSTLIAETDAQGRFSFSEMPEEFVIIASHETGFARIDCVDFTPSTPIRLERWGQIEGTLYLSDEPINNETVTLSFDTQNRYAALISYDHQAIIKTQGRFVFRQVVPGWLTIGRQIRRGHALDISTCRRTIYVEPGQTLNITLGKAGRPIVGKLALAPDDNGMVYSTPAFCLLETTRPEPAWPAGSEQWSGTQKAQWYKQWSKTEEGRAYSEAVYHNPNRRTWNFTVGEDNTFRIENATPGSYTLYVPLGVLGSQHGPNNPYRSAIIQVPPMAETYSTEALDLGEVVLTQIQGEDTGASTSRDSRDTVTEPDVRHCMKQLGLAVALHMNDHDGQLPESLGPLKRYFHKPGDFAWVQANVTYMGKGNVKDYPKPYATITGYETTPHPTGQRYVTFLDGHIALLDVDRFKKLIAATAESSDESAETLQQLIDGAEAGSVVTVPEGSYAEPIHITKPVTLRGAYREDCVLEVTADEPAISVDTGGQGGVALENLTIRWQLASQDPVQRPFALHVKNTKVVVRHCQVTGMGDYRRSPVGINLERSPRAAIDGCHLSGFEYVVCVRNGTEAIVEDCFVADCGHQGVINYSGSTMTVRRCIITGSKYHAIRCTGGTLHVRDNLLIANANRGIYLGNKTGRGTIVNNLILGNGTGISGFGRATYTIENNVVANNEYAAISMRDFCRLSIANNTLTGNGRGVILHKEGGQDTNQLATNLFWDNDRNVEDFDQAVTCLVVDPQFVDPNGGDFSVRGPAKEQGQGLSDPEIIQQLWQKLKGRSPIGSSPRQPADEAPAQTSISGNLAWQRTDRYVAPDPEGFFPDDVEGGKRLDALFQAVDKDRRSDEEILSTVRRGFRRTKQYRTLVLRWIGNRYIWGEDPQNAEAIEIMYHAVPMERHYAVYFGLSVMKHKTPNVLRTLAEICMQGEDVGRITWGLGRQRQEIIPYIEPHLKDTDTQKREIASVLVRHFKGEIDFDQWKEDKRQEAARAQFGDRLPEFKETLLNGDSRARRDVIDTINRNRLMPLLDDSFLPAMAAAATDKNRKVRNDAGRMTGGRWVWGAKEQNADAIALMLKLASDPDREVRYNAVYYGLSVVRDKSEAVIRRLIEMALADHENNLYGRIVWGLKGPMRADPESVKAVLSEYVERAKSNRTLAAAIDTLYRDVLETAPPAEWGLGDVSEDYPTDLFTISFSPANSFDAKDTDAVWTEFSRTVPDGVVVQRMPTFRNRDSKVCTARVRGESQVNAVKEAIEKNAKLVFGRTAPLPVSRQLYLQEQLGMTPLAAPSEPTTSSPEEGPGPIQRRINAASPGDTVTLEPGVYEEPLIIDKPLTLQGAGWEQTALMRRIELAEIAEKIQATIRQRTAGVSSGDERRKITAEIQKEYRDRVLAPTLLVTSARGVVIRGIRFSHSGKPTEGTLASLSVVKFDDSEVRMEDCAILGGVGNGLYVTDDSDVEIDRTLVAATWSTGLIVGERSSRPCRVHIHDCDIRNNYYAGIRIRPGNDQVRIERCRISGAAWHGIRYDDASPTIENNLIFGSARSGIYASRKTAATIKGNLFYANEMGGMSCWFQNTDTIEGNTFADNKQIGLSILGASHPVVRRNIFYDHPTAIATGYIDDDSPSAKSDGRMNLKSNLFWSNEREAQKRVGEEMQPVALAEETESLRIDPKFTAAAAKDFSLKTDSPSRRAGIGALDLIPFESPWPLQAEESAIIPSGPTRHYRQWKGKD